MSWRHRKRVWVAFVCASLIAGAAQLVFAQFPGGVRAGTLVDIVPPDPPPDNPPDTTNPTVTITTPSGTTHDNGASTTLQVSGTWSDASGQISGVTWDNNQDMASAAACTPGVGTFWGCTVTGMIGSLGGTINAITVFVTDIFGNVGSDSVAVTVTTPAGGTCVAGAGACGDSLDNTTPAVGQTVSLAGQDLHQRVTTNWDSFFTTNLNRYSFEATNGSDLTVLGYAPGTGAGHTVSNTVAVLGSTSAFFNSANSGPYCQAGGQGIATSYTYANLPNDTDFWWKEYIYWTAPGGWPSNFLKHIELPSTQFLFQPKLTGQGGLAPSQFVAQQAGGSGSVVMDGGARIQEGRWYFMEAHVVRTTPNALEMWVDGLQVASTPVGPIANNQVNSVNLFGLVNACSAYNVGPAWDVRLYMDGMVRGQARMYPDAEVWLCDQDTDDPRTNPATAGCVWQVPQHISDTQIIFTFRKTQTTTTVPSGTRYIKVVNNERQLSNALSVTVP